MGFRTGIPARPGLKARRLARTPADPFNEHEPVDSSAAAIAAQGLLRLGRYLQGRSVLAGWPDGAADTLFDEPYLSTDPEHQGLILHSVYHRPNGWDAIRRRASIPCGEVIDVGRLSRAGTGAVSATRLREQAVSDLLERIRQ